MASEGTEMADNTARNGAGGLPTGRIGPDRKGGRGRAEAAWNPWKLATLGLLLVLGAPLVTGWVVAHRSPSEPARGPETSRSKLAASRGQPAAAAQPETPPVSPVSLQPDIEACNRCARAQTRSWEPAFEVAKDALIGGGRDRSDCGRW